MKYSRMIRKAAVICVIVSLTMLPAFAKAQFNHETWAELLQANVKMLNNGQASEVDYEAMMRDRARLTSYLDQIASVTRSDFDRWLETEQLSFLINAYNAATVELVLTQYPDIDSIRDIGSLFRSAFRRDFISLFNYEVSLDYIEHDLIRGPDGYNEPRIHFAVNCASIGCPALSNEVFDSDQLDQQLEKATTGFLADRSRNFLDGNTLRVSKIFDWYREDFEAGCRGANELGKFLALYSEALGLSENDKARLIAGEIRIRFNRYDWTLNDLNDLND